MLNSDGGLDLRVSVSARDWGYAQRRITYLEAVIVQVLRDLDNITEWYSAVDFAGMRLPGLPATPAGITRHATVNGWIRRRAAGRGGPFEYHFTSLPCRAFDAMITRIIDVPDAERMDAMDAVEYAPAIPNAPDNGTAPDNASPAWLLPLLRVIRERGPVTLQSALRTLPGTLPPGVACPTFEEADSYLRRLGMVVDG